MRTNQIVHRIEEAHDGPISELVFFPREYYGLGNDISTDNDIATEPPATLIMSASQDGTVKLFDLRVTSSSSQTSQSNSQKVVLASASEDGLLTIHDPSQSTEEAALLSVMNVGSPLWYDALDSLDRSTRVYMHLRGMRL